MSLHYTDPSNLLGDAPIAAIAAATGTYQLPTAERKRKSWKSGGWGWGQKWRRVSHDRNNEATSAALCYNVMQTRQDARWDSFSRLKGRLPSGRMQSFFLSHVGQHMIKAKFTTNSSVHLRILERIIFPEVRRQSAENNAGCCKNVNIKQSIQHLHKLLQQSFILAALKKLKLNYNIQHEDEDQHRRHQYRRPLPLLLCYSHHC